MSGPTSVEVYDGDGNAVWRGEESELRTFAPPSSMDSTALAYLKDPRDTVSCTRNDVTRTAEELGFVSRRGIPKGFVAILPPGKLLEACVDAFNRPHLADLEVNPVDFPLVFDRGGERMAELTAPYEKQGRMFTLGQPDENLRLSYAADPNLFAWLEDQTLARANLPYAIYSPQPVFRRFQSGEFSIQRTRQFTVPDIHLLATREDARERYLRALELAGESTSFWFGSDYVHVMDTVEGSTLDDPAFASRAAKAVGGTTVVRRLAARPKYYAQKSGVMVFGGYDNIMLYNLQFDEVNPARFNIRTDDGELVVVIHASVAMGCSRMLPLVLGRGLAGISAKTIPVELATHQVVFVPLREEHLARVRQLAATLHRAGVRIDIDRDFGRSTGARLGRLRRRWRPLLAVVGDRELTGPVRLESPDRTVSTTVEELLATQGERLTRCRPAFPGLTMDLPIARPS